tara:strand:- start:57 stop:917 length:861 start_codon:yes stop_codon:yes gene_type:complete
MNKNELELVLGRKEFKELIDIRHHDFLKNKKVLITGANGSVGAHFQKVLKEAGVEFLATDIDGNLEYLDITDFGDCLKWVNKFNPDFIVNIAGLKYATKSEHQSWKTVKVNIEGTKNLIDVSKKECKVILTSTCKSCNPEIVYGATKLIAERMVINAGGSVARFFNVVQSQGNVFEIWHNTNPKHPIKVVEECNRYFISIDEAVGLILYSMLYPGRFIVNNRVFRNMKDVANDLLPNKEKLYIEKRRGDRKNEIFLSTSEKENYEVLEGKILKVVGDHDKINNYTE